MMKMAANSLTQPRKENFHDTITNVTSYDMEEFN